MMILKPEEIFQSSHFGKAMTEEKRTDNMSDIHRGYYEDEINIFDSFMMLWRWKWFIAVGTLLAVIVGFVIALQMPEKYVASMAIEPSVIGLDGKGNKLYADSKGIINEIEGGKYNGEIKKSLTNPPVHSALAFTAQSDRYSNLIKVESQWAKDDLAIGLEASKKLGLLLIEDHKESIEQRKKEIGALIKTEREKIEKNKKNMEDTVRQSVRFHSNQVDVFQEKIVLNEQLLDITRIRQKKLADDLKNADDALGEVIVQRDNILKGGRDEAFEFLPEYEIAIRDWWFHISRIEEQIFTAKVQERKIVSDIKMAELEIVSHRQAVQDIETEQADRLQESIKKLNEEIEKQTVIREAIGNITIIREPEILPAPVNSSSGKKIIFLTGVAALFMFIFLAFFIEYIKNARREYLLGKGKE
jgi:hypothetical protein